jgi:hypothetical protein
MWVISRIVGPRVALKEVDHAQVTLFSDQDHLSDAGFRHRGHHPCQWSLLRTKRRCAPAEPNASTTDGESAPLQRKPSDRGAAKSVTKPCSRSAAANDPVMINQRGAQQQAAGRIATTANEDQFRRLREREAAIGRSRRPAFPNVWHCTFQRPIIYAYRTLGRQEMSATMALVPGPDRDWSRSLRQPRPCRSWSEDDVGRITGHRSVFVLRRYVQAAAVFDGDAAASARAMRVTTRR